MKYHEEVALMKYTAKEVGILYEHPIDKDCYVFRSEDGFVIKTPKDFVDHPKLKEILRESSN